MEKFQNILDEEMKKEPKYVKCTYCGIHHSKESFHKCKYFNLGEVPKEERKIDISL